MARVDVALPPEAVQDPPLGELVDRPPRRKRQQGMNMKIVRGMAIDRARDMNMVVGEIASDTAKELPERLQRPFFRDMVLDMTAVDHDVLPEGSCHPVRPRRAGSDVRGDRVSEPFGRVCLDKRPVFDHHRYSAFGRSVDLRQPVKVGSLRGVRSLDGTFCFRTPLTTRPSNGVLLGVRDADPVACIGGRLRRFDYWPAVRVLNDDH